MTTAADVVIAIVMKNIYSFLNIFAFICLKGKKRERRILIFLLLQFANAHFSWCWIRLKSRVWNSFGVSHVGHGTMFLSQHLLALTLAGIRTGSGDARLKLVCRFRFNPLCDDASSYLLLFKIYFELSRQHLCNECFFSFIFQTNSWGKHNFDPRFLHEEFKVKPCE